jgi:glutamine---fructose-6-phosphate transaminase (isomerizing)
MCGLFGFATSQGAGPNLKTLKAIAAVTESRGAHAFGFAWIDDTGLHAYKQPGRITDHLDALDQLADARMVIGHCRYATHGHPAVNDNNHPHKAGREYIVHNGVITNHRELILDNDLEPITECDSEVLALLIPRQGGSLTHRVRHAAEQTDGRIAILGLWAGPDRIVACRRDNPLCFAATGRGLYLASLPHAMPARTYELQNNTARTFTFDGRGTTASPIAWLQEPYRMQASFLPF